MSDTQARVNHYSQAILQTVIERWQTALTQVADAVASNATVNVLLVDAGKDAASKIAGLEKVLPAGLPAEVTNFIKLLVQEGDFALLPQVSASLSPFGKRQVWRPTQGGYYKRRGPHARRTGQFAPDAQRAARRWSCLQFPRGPITHGRVARACG
jgi:hypothetical protein